MRKASRALLEQGTQPSPAPDLIPAETKINRGLTLRLVQQTGALQSDSSTILLAKVAGSTSRARFAINLQFSRISFDSDSVRIK